MMRRATAITASTMTAKIHHDTTVPSSSSSYTDVSFPARHDAGEPPHEQPDDAHAARSPCDEHAPHAVLPADHPHPTAAAQSSAAVYATHDPQLPEIQPQPPAVQNDTEVYVAQDTQLPAVVSHAQPDVVHCCGSVYAEHVAHELPPSSHPHPAAAHTCALPCTEHGAQVIWADVIHPQPEAAHLQRTTEVAHDPQAPR